jgi:hypothetical protein
MSLVSRQWLYGSLAAVVCLAIIMATAQAALVYRAVGPIIAAALGVALFPVLIRGASTGVMRTWTAWVVASVGCIISVTATIGLDPAQLDAVSICWLTCGVLAGAVMVWMAGHPLPPLFAVSFLVLHFLNWAGPVGVLRLGLVAEIVIVAAGMSLRGAVRRVTAAAHAASESAREVSIWHAEQDAFHLERQSRLERAGRNAAPMLQRIIDQGGILDDAARRECRVLEQTLRDEIRGRNLLNDAVRQAVLAHRQRGAFVQVLDDGGLRGLAPRDLNLLLDEVARRIAPVRSSRIVIRTGAPETTTAITIVATTTDEIASALGLDDDEHVDLWAQIPRPVAAPALV